MQSVRLGRTNLLVRRLGFGGIPIQTVSREQALATVWHAYQRGMNFFDTAQGYTVSESIIGEALQGVRDQVYLATKSAGKDVATVERHLAASLANLRTDHIDLYQLHNVVGDETLGRLVAPGGVLDYLREQQSRGVIGQIGITSHRLDTALKAVRSNLFATVQFPFNFIESDAASELFPLARQLDVGIIVMKPIAGGAMTDPAASIKWILEQCTDVVIPGMESCELVDRNLEAAEAGALTAEELQALEQLKAELGPVFCRRCAYCLPCPQGIPVNFLASAELFFNRSGWHKLDEGHVDSFRKGLDCSGCQTCEARCPYELPLSRIIPDNSRRLLEKAKQLGKC